MKHFILTLLMIVVFAFNAQALNFVVEEDEAESLPVTETTQAMNEESKTETKTEETTPVEQVAEAVTTEETAIQEPVSQEENIEEDEEEEEEKEEEKVYLAINHVETTEAAVRVVSYCSGAFVLFNGTKKNVQEISGTLGIGDQKKKFKFTDVAPGSSVGWPFQLVGRACERKTIFALPDIQISKCQIERMSDKKCRSKLLFVPIPDKSN